MAPPDVLVIGAGVSGLTTAIWLAEHGRSVGVVSALPPHSTTSAVAGASWGPYMVEDQRVLEWSALTRLILEELSDDPDTGVHLIDGVEASDKLTRPPDWAVAAPGFRLCAADELAALPEPYVTGWRYRIPVIDMPAYLGYLQRRLEVLRVPIEIHHVATFAEVAGKAAALVNCTGLGSRALVPDAELYPVRGQLVVTENPGIEEFFQDDVHGDALTYILPHSGHVVLGGCVQYSEHLQPDERTAAGIVERCVAIEPRLARARVVGHRVGFRPTRSAVRTERVSYGRKPLVHNYGHGGSGVTLSWGCANEVLRLLDDE
jgi:D-amino-acid oxidase